MATNTDRPPKAPYFGAAGLLRRFAAFQPMTSFGVMIAALALASCASPAGNGGVLRAASNPIQIRDGGEVSNWTLAREQNPDIYSAGVAAGEEREVCFIAGERSLCRGIRLGEQVDFVVRHDGFDYPTRVVGILPAANFDAAYQTAHRGRVDVEIPEVYELVNVAIAMTPAARSNNYLVVRNTPYYHDVETRFSRFAEHPFVVALDRALAAGQYFPVKMNGYAFVFDATGRIVHSPNYNRTGFTGSTDNPLTPLVAEMQDFADVSGFREFFRAHESVYRQQEDYYREAVNLEAMLQWLRVQFPRVRAYDGEKVVFSPLVGANQSATWLTNNGYRELQAHVNFLYSSQQEGEFSPQSIPLRRGRIVFTELNHGFINPAAEDHAEEISGAITDLSFWADAGTSSDNYRSAQGLFLEMMNWALISLYEYDMAPEADRERLNADLDRIMGRGGRGFPQFAAFRTELLRLYRGRSPTSTVQDLYPAMISWCLTHQRAAKLSERANELRRRVGQLTRAARLPCESSSADQ